jgi:hypothetical protein
MYRFEGLKSYVVWNLEIPREFLNYNAGIKMFEIVISIPATPKKRLNAHHEKVK